MIFNLVWLPARQTGSSTRTKVLLRIMLRDTTVHLAVLHAGQVLDGAGDADGDVQLGRHDLAGLAALVVVGHKSGIDSGPTGTARRPELVRERVQHREVLARAHAAAA